MQMHDEVVLAIMRNNPGSIRWWVKRRTYLVTSSGKRGLDASANRDHLYRPGTICFYIEHHWLISREESLALIWPDCIDEQITLPMYCLDDEVAAAIMCEADRRNPRWRSHLIRRRSTLAFQ